MSSAVAHALPPSILALFAPRVPLEYKPPLEKRKMPPYTGFAQHVDQFEDSADTPPPQLVETIEERRARRQEAKATAAKARLEPLVAAYDPAANAEGKSADPYKTIFVARMDYATTEATLRAAFEQFGPIKSAQIVKDTLTGKSRGYGFIEYEHERDMKVAYKQGDAKKIDGRRVLVDVERGRTVRNWRPRRLGGGLGSTRAGGKGQAVNNSGRDVAGGSGAATAAVQPASTYTASARTGERSAPYVAGGAAASSGSAPTFSWSTRSDDRGGGGGGRSGLGYGDRDRDRDRGGGDRGGGGSYSSGGYGGSSGGGYGGGGYGGGGYGGSDRDRERDRDARRGGDDYDRRRREDDSRRRDEYERRREDDYGYDRRDRRRDEDYYDRGDRGGDRGDRGGDRGRRDDDYYASSRDRRRDEERERERERDRRGSGGTSGAGAPKPSLDDGQIAE